MRPAAVRVRVTLVFARAMTALFAALAVWLVVRVGDQLDEAIDDGLRARAADVAAQAPTGARAPSSDARFTEVAAAGSPYPPRTESRMFEGEPTRMRVMAVRAGAHLVVVGQSLEARDEAVAQLKAQLLFGLPLAVLATCVAGYLAAAGALRPVRLMTRRAREISGGDAGARLPVPDTADEIADLGTTLNAMLARLQRALERERAFVADASHELRAPLTTIGVELDVALKTAATEADYRAAITNASLETRRVVGLAEDLLVLARADQGRLPMRPETVDLGVLTGAAAARVRARADALGITVGVEAERDLFTVADERRLDQLLDNLTDNALRFARTRVQLRAYRRRSRLVITVSDDLPGFPVDFAARAFDRFAVADHARTGSHTGLGLAIVDAIARAHRWTVSIRPTAPGTGATVEVVVPRLEIGDL
jgi:signal transduction histidine kinase